MYILKKFKRSLIALIIICVIAGFGFIHKSVIETSATPVKFKTVIIDPGHGGLTNTTH